MKPFDTVILDIDGTLLDSNDAHARSWSDALGKHGHQVPAEKVRPLIGMGGDRLLPELTGIELDSEEGRAIAEARRQIFREEYLPHLEPFDGVRELLLELRRRGFRLTVATSAEEDLVQDLLLRAHVQDLIESTTSSDDAENSKPAPDIVEAAVDEADTQPQRAIMLGDTPYDVEAAHGAGVPIIAFTCGGWPENALRDAEAVYRDAADLRARIEESPLVSR